MPGGDRTGPLGMGPRTGRGAGYCSGSDAPGFVAGGGYRGRGIGYGRGCGFGRGGGRGWRNRFHATGQPGWVRFGAPYGVTAAPDAESEKRALQNEAEALQAELVAVNQRLAALQGNAEDDN